MKKSSILTMPEYFDKYINLTEDVTHLEALDNSLKELQGIPLDLWKSLGDTVYALGKWTLKDILLHCIDTERVFIYRAMSFARGDQQKVLTFNEDEYAKNAGANTRTFEDLIEEAIVVRKGSIAFYASLSDEQLQKSGAGMNGLSYSVLALAFMIAGHQHWHFKVIQERYLSLLENK